MKTSRQVVTFALLSCLFVVVASVGAAASPSAYDVRVTLDPTEQMLVGSQRVEYVNETDEPVDEILFALLANAGAEPNPYLHPAIADAQYVRGFDPMWTRIHGVTDADGAPLAYTLEPSPPALQTYALEDGILAVALPESLAPGDRFTLNIDFETRFANALVMDQFVYRDTYVWRFGWNPIVVPAAARNGGYVLPAATYRVEVTVPEAYRLFAGADRQVERDPVAGLTTYELITDGPVRSVPLLIGTDLESVSLMWNDVELVAVYLPGGETFARLTLTYLAEILASHSDRFGPFGSRRLIVAENPAPGFFGMAADGMILVGRSLSRLKDMPALGTYDRLIEYLLAHEAAHLWWGIGIGTDFDAENWLSEGFAEYLSISYFEEKYGADEPNLFSHLGPGLTEDIVREAIGDVNLRRHLSEAPYLDLLKLGFDEPIVRPMADVEYLNGQTVRVYNKGYLVLRALGARIGQDTLRAALAEIHAAWRGRILDVEGFRRSIEDASDANLADFFDDWLYGTATFDVTVERFETATSHDGYTTTVHLRRAGAVLPVEIEATLADRSTERRTWNAEATTDTVVFETASPVVRIHADPDEMLPDVNRFDNHSPRRILVDHPFRSDDAPSIGRPLDAYVISISPIGLSGGFRNDHQWSLTAIPHLDPDASYDDLADVFQAWDVVAAFAATVDRRLSFSATATITAFDPSNTTGTVDLQATVQTLGFSHPEIGAAGTYWYPTRVLDLTLGIRGELPDPIPYVSVAVGRSDLLAHFMENVLTACAGIPGAGVEPFATVAWSGLKRIRLAPHLYLDISTSAGGSLLETLPTDFMFSMDRLRAFALPPYGNFQYFGTAELVLPPLVRDVGYPVLNVTRVEDIVATVFVQGGRTWGGCDRVCEPGVRVEAGAQLTFLVDAVLGSQLALSVGYAYPLLGSDGEPSVFVEFAVPR